MALSDISLTAGMRGNLISLQQTTELLTRTQNRMATGKKVNTALDDPVNFFAAQGHLQRASDLAVRKDGMSEAIQTIKAADAGIKGITDLIQQAKSLATAALSTSDTTERSDLATQFDALLDQIDNLASDSGYKGTNLLASGVTLTVNFNEDGSSNLAITSSDSSSTGLGVAAAAGSWAAEANITAAADDLSAALSTLRSTSKTLSSNLTIVTTRQDFTNNMIDTLQTGADNLTLADMNEEGANMLMLQTRQALGVTALSLSSQAAQSVLKLF